MTKHFQILSQAIRGYDRNTMATVCFAHDFKALDTGLEFFICSDFVLKTSDKFWLAYASEFWDQLLFGNQLFIFFLIRNIVMEGIIALSHCFKS